MDPDVAAMMGFGQPRSDHLMPIQFLQPLFESKWLFTFQIMFFS